MVPAELTGIVKSAASRWWRSNASAIGRAADVARADDEGSPPHGAMNGRPTIRRVSQPAENHPDQARAAAVEPSRPPASSCSATATEGLEVLMLRRTAKASFAPDAWVFPGGRIDPGDGARSGLDGGGAAGRGPRDAGRGRRRRRSAGADPVLAVVSAAGEPEAVPHLVLRGRGRHGGRGDGRRRRDHRARVGAAGRRDRRPRRGPDHPAAADLGDALGARPARDRRPRRWRRRGQASRRSSKRTSRFVPRDDDPEKKDVVSLWEGDAGYESRDPHAPGARHRLRMGAPPWRYERTA